MVREEVEYNGVNPSSLKIIQMSPYKKPRKIFLDYFLIHQSLATFADTGMHKILLFVTEGIPFWAMSRSSTAGAQSLQRTDQMKAKLHHEAAARWQGFTNASMDSTTSPLVMLTEFPRGALCIICLHNCCFLVGKI